MKTFFLTISTPDQAVFSGQAQRLDVRGTEGALSIMAGHIPFATAVVQGELAVVSETGEKKTAHSAGGILSVDTNKVTLLTATFSFDE